MLQIAICSQLRCLKAVGLPHSDGSVPERLVLPSVRFVSDGNKAQPGCKWPWRGKPQKSKADKAGKEPASAQLSGSVPVQQLTQKTLYCLKMSQLCCTPSRTDVQQWQFHERSFSMACLCSVNLLVLTAMQVKGARQAIAALVSHDMLQEGSSNCYASNC